MISVTLTTEHQTLCLAARTQIGPDDEQRLLALLRGPLDWERLREQGQLHEVLPLMTATLHRLRGQAPIPEAWRARAQQESCNTLAYNFMLASELTCVLNALRQAGVEGIPVKGVVLAETVYGNLALRPMADLDVLVRPSDLPAARAVLRSLGYSHRVQPLFEELHHSFHDPQYFRQASGGQICLELHWALWAAHFFDLKVEALWKRAVPAQVQGTKVRILSPEELAPASCDPSLARATTAARDL